MSDEAIVSEAPAAVVDADVVHLPNPISTESTNSEAEGKPEPKVTEASAEKKLTARESLELAAAKIDKAQKATEVTDKAKPVETQAQRDEKGKFKPAEEAKPDSTAKVDPAKADKAPVTHNIAEPPKRFSDDAKAAWATAPDPVKHEIHRAIRNLESGIEEHAKRWAPLKEYADLAEKSNTTIDRALKEYVGIDKLLGENFMAGIERICANKGINLRDFAAHVVGQTPDQARSQGDTEIRQLKQTVAQLQEQLGGVTGSMKQQTEAQVNQEIAAFKENDHPLFDELSEEIATHITNNGLSLEMAYDKAVTDAQEKALRLGFITPPSQPPVAEQDPKAQTLKGQISIKGAPSFGSSPANQKPSPSIKDALRRAMQAAG